MNPENAINQFKNKIIISFFLYYTIHDQFYIPHNPELKNVIKTISDSNIENIPSIIKSFILESPLPSINNPIVKLKEFISKLDQKFDTFKEFRSSSSNNYTFLINEEICKSLKDIFDIWLNNEFIFSFSWKNLSAGQAALLTLFSRIKSVSDFPHFEDTIWLLIDEGDLYLHPEWQRTFFADLHKYLPLFFNNHKLQLIISSHSPFIVSDLPKENIILLDRIDGLCKVVEKDMFSNTFGANIHSLLTDSFFLTGGLIGEFAKEKINDLFTYLIDESETDNNFNYDTAKKLIDLIGEPIVKLQLIQLFDKKFDKKSEIEWIEEQMVQLEKRKNELK